MELDLISTNLNLSNCTFVENTAVLTPTFAVISNPGMLSGIDEVFEMESSLKTYYDTIYYIQAPGTLECEDVLQIENHFYISVSAKTNQVRHNNESKFLNLKITRLILFLIQNYLI